MSRLERAAPWLVVTLAVGLHALSLDTWFDDETIRFFVLPRPGRWNLPGGLFGNWTDLPTASQTLRPVMVLSFALNLLIGERWAPGYHGINLALHGLACWLLYRLACRLTGRPSVGLTAGLLMAVHPLTTQPMWILGDRAEQAVTVGGLLAMERWLAFRRGGGLGAALASLGGLVLALGSKETAATIPILILLLEWFRPVQSEGSETWGASPILSWRRWVGPVGHWGVLVVYLLYRAAALGGTGGYGSSSPLSLEHTIPVFLQNVDWLLWLPLTRLPGLLGWSGPVVLLLAALLPRRRWALFGLLWMGATLVPTNNLCQMWYLYFPLAGLCLTAGVALDRLWTGRLLRLAVPVLMLVVGLLAWQSADELVRRRRNAVVGPEMARLLQQALPDPEPGARLVLRLPRGVRMSELEGFFFRPETFLVERNPSPLRGIVWDLNRTRFYRGVPVYSSLVQPTARLLYGDLALSVVLREWAQPLEAGSARVHEFALEIGPGESMELRSL